jgi:hypothetical protein
VCASYHPANGFDLGLAMWNVNGRLVRLGLGITSANRYCIYRAIRASTAGRVCVSVGRRTELWY